MATTAVKKSKARTGLVQSARMGPFSLFTAVAGAVVGGLAFAGLVAGTRTVLERNNSTIDLSQAWDGLGRRSALVLAGLMFVSYLLAAFVAGRIAWRRGWLRGLAAEIDIRDRIEAEAASASQSHSDADADSNFDVDIDGLNKEELYGMAQELEIAGRSQMTKEDLARSVRRELRTESRST